MQSESKSESNLKIFKNLLKYVNIFFNKKISILSTLKRKDYIISLNKNKKLLYKSLYNLS